MRRLGVIIISSILAVACTEADPEFFGEQASEIPTAVGSLSRSSQYIQSTANSPIFTWSHALASDGIMDYQVAIGTTDGGQEAMPWTSIGVVTSYQCVGCTSPFTSESTYYLAIKAIDGDSEEGPVATISFVPDTTAPSTPTGLDLTTFFNGNYFYANNNDTPPITWNDDSSDGGIVSGYEVEIEQITPGPSTLSPYASTNTRTSHQVTSMAGALTHGNMFRVHLRAVDGAGNFSSSVSIDWTPDTGGPSVPVIVGDITYSQDQDGAGSITLSGLPVDTTSGLQRLEIAVGTSAGSADITSASGLGTAGWVTVPNTVGPHLIASGISPALSHGGTYHLSIRAIDNVGNISTFASDDFIADGIAPQAVGITTPPITWWNDDNDAPMVNWNDCTHTPAPGTSTFNYEYVVGTSGLGSDELHTLSSTFVNNIAVGPYNVANATNGQTVDVSFRCVDVAGNAGPWTSYNFQMDISPPALASNLSATGGPTFVSGPATFSSHASDSPLIDWNPASDIGPSGVASYDLRIGSADGLGDVHIENVVPDSHTFTGAGSDFTSVTGGIVEGQRYYYSVVAIDNAGNNGGTHSEGKYIIYDYSPPSDISGFSALPAWDSQIQTPPITFAASSDSPAVEPSGVSHYEIAVGTSIGDTSIVNWTSIGGPGAISNYQHSIPSQVFGWYYIGLQAVDNVGNISTPIWHAWEIVDTDYLVTTTADGSDASIDGTCEVNLGVGDCSIRAALDEAANDGSNSKIFIPDGTYVFPSGFTMGTGNTEEIIGQGKYSTIIDMNSTNRFLVFNNGTLNVSDLTLYNGQVAGGGGAIYVLGGSTNSNFTRVNFNDNHATSGLADGGALHLNGGGNHTIVDSSFQNNQADDNGGALYLGASGTVDIDECTFNENEVTGFDGGAIYINDGTVKVLRSSLYQNRSDDDGSAIFATGPSITSIINSTISRNIAGNSGTGRGAVTLDGGAPNITIKNSTIAYNSSLMVGGVGGLRAQGSPSTDSLSVENSIVAHNFNEVGTSSNCGGPSTAYLSLGANIEDANTCNTEFDGPGDLLNTFPGLDHSLELRGGNTTIIGLLPNSAALDIASNCTGDTLNDQIHQGRVGACDSGAYEQQAVEPPKSLAYDLKLLRFRVGQLDSSGAPSHKGGTPTAGNWMVVPPLPSDLGLSVNPNNGVISGVASYNYVGDHFVSASNAGGSAVVPVKVAALNGFIVNSFGDQAISGSSSDGVCNSTVGTCTLRAAISEVNGMALSEMQYIYLPDGTYNLGSDLVGSVNMAIVGQSQAGTILDGGSANRHFNFGSNVAINAVFINLTLQNGFNSGSGGSMFINQNYKDFYFGNVTFLSNSSNNTGGALYFGSAGTNNEADFEKCTFSGNIALGASGGGGIYFDPPSSSDSLAITQTTFANNNASGSTRGGAIHISSQGEAKIHQSYFDNNSSAGNGGGAIMNTSTGEVQVFNSTFYQNSSSAGGGGAIHHSPSSPGTMLLVNNTFLDNDVSGGSTGARAGALYSSGTGAVTILGNNIFQDNTELGSTPMNCDDGAGAVIVSWGGNVSDMFATNCSLSVARDKPAENDADILNTAIPANNGGPVDTINLFSASEAVDSANPNICIDHDARGERRSRDGDVDGDYICDAGALEF